MDAAIAESHRSQRSHHSTVIRFGIVRISTEKSACRKRSPRLASFLDGIRAGGQAFSDWFAFEGAPLSRVSRVAISARPLSFLSVRFCSSFFPLTPSRNCLDPFTKLLTSWYSHAGCLRLGGRRRRAWVLGAPVPLSLCHSESAQAERNLHFLFGGVSEITPRPRRFTL